MGNLHVSTHHKIKLQWQILSKESKGNLEQEKSSHITTVYSQEFYSLWLIPFPEFPHFPKVCHVLSTFLVLYMSDSLMKLKHESQSTIIYSTICILKNIISTSKNWLCKKSLVLCFKSLQPKLEHFLKDLNSSWTALNGLKITCV